MRVAEARSHKGVRRRVHAGDRGERGDADLRPGSARGQALQGRQHRGVVEIDEPLPRRVTLPAARAVESAHEFGHGEPVEPDGLPRPAIGGIDPVDAAAIRAGPQVGIGHDRAVDPLRMLDIEPVHVDHVEGPVGTGLRHHRPRPGVGRREKLPRLFIVRTAARETRPRGGEHAAVDEIRDRIADEGVA
jgi:hypothetical protein